MKKSKNILILDCGCQNYGVGGTLNHFYSDYAMKELEKMGHQVKLTLVEGSWEVEEEVEKIKWADVLIVQTPGWWMTTPWQFVRYEDLVFVKIASGDGRHHQTPDKGYGTGGTLTDKHYMISSTWNAPKAAFDREGDFFEGRGVDGVFFPLRKAFEFLGLKQLPSFMANDVIKNPTFDDDKKRFKEHLKKVFGEE